LEWPKLKNIILLILLIVNLFLFVLVAYHEVRRTWYLDSARENAVGVMAQNGINVDLEALPRDTTLVRLSMVRDRQQEAGIAAALLGTASETGQGGTIEYTGEKGTARFSRSGAFSAALRPDAYPLGEQTVAAHALATLALLNFDGEVLTVKEHGEQTVVTVYQLWQGTPVFTCLVTLVYESGALVSIQDGSSCRLTGVPEASGTADNFSVVTALMRFLEEMSNQGYVCTSLTGMTPGYTFSSGLSDPITLRPVWQITTDTGAYYLDSETGVLTRAG